MGPIDSCDENSLYSHKVYFRTNVNKFNVHWAKRIPFTIPNTDSEIGLCWSLFWNDFRSTNSLMMTELMYQKLFRSYVHSELRFWYEIPPIVRFQWNSYGCVSLFFFKSHLLMEFRIRSLAQDSCVFECFTCSLATKTLSETQNVFSIRLLRLTSFCNWWIKREMCVISTVKISCLFSLFCFAMLL